MKFKSIGQLTQQKCKNFLVRFT